MLAFGRLGDRCLAAVFALTLLSPAFLAAQTPELDSIRRDPMRMDAGPANARPPVIVNTPDPRFQGVQPLPGTGERQPGVGERPPGAVPQFAPPAPPKPEERVEFQNFVTFAVGRDLPLFGYDLFRDQISTFAPVESLPATADYTIGPGDEIQVRAWGQVDIDYRTVVDRDGRIHIPRIGNITVAGTKYSELDNRITAAVRRVFKNFELSATLGQLRSIQIFVVGHAKQPGTYTVSSLSTLVNALFVSGGPSAKGSMRRIQLKRNGKLVTEFDVYDLLLNGDTSKDARLLPGDVIFIPSVGPRAAVAGSINAPAIYELRNSATVGDLITMAGGLTPTAAGQRITLERIVERRARTVRELTLDDHGLQQPLANGDVVTVYTLSPRIHNAVTLKGNVAQTMRFPWVKGMRVSNVIPEKDALIVPDYWLNRNRQGVVQSWLDSTPQQQLEEEEKQRDRARELEEPATTPSGSTGERRPQNDSADGSSATRVSGALLHPRGKQAPIDSARLRQDVKRVSTEINWDYAVIERLNSTDLSTSLIPFNLGKAVLQKVAQDDVELMPGDVITVFSKDDLQIPSNRQTKYVRLEGELIAAGVYQVQPGETLKQLIQRVGGVTHNAYLFGAEFTRESTRLQQQKQLEDALTRLEQEAQRVALARSQAVVAPEDAQALGSQAAATNALIAKLRAVRATGRIVLELPGENATVLDLPELVLEDGDRFYIPPEPSTVAVFGAVYNPNAYVYKGGRPLGFYLSRAGGPTKDADKRSIYLVRADGTVISNRQKGWFGNVNSQQLSPGDAVVVPESFDRFNLTKELKDWTQILYQLALGVAGLKVLNDL